MVYCYVPFCKGGSAAQKEHYSENDLPPLRFFQPPNEAARKLWDGLIKRKRPLKMTDKICSFHFEDRDIITHDKFFVHGREELHPRKRATLKDGAIPIKFENYPSYYQPKVSQRMKKVLKEKCENVISKRRRVAPVEENLLAPEEPPADNEIIERGLPPPDQNIAVPLQNNHQFTLNINELQLPDGWVVFNKNKVVHINNDNETSKIDREIEFKSNLPPKIILLGKFNYNIGDLAKNNITNVVEAQKALTEVNQLKLCEGTNYKDKPFSQGCSGAILSIKHKKCPDCLRERERLRKTKVRQEKTKEKKTVKFEKKKQSIRNMTKKGIRLQQKIRKFRRIVHEKMIECSIKNEQVLEAAIKDLPKIQQEVVKECFKASKRKSSRGNRYSIEWVYECMLMRIKSPKLYHHIWEKGILAVPCISTMRGYLKNFSGAYGYHPGTFKLLSEKAKEMEPAKRRGVLLIDEAKLTPGVHFDASTLTVQGFIRWPENNNLEQFGDEIQEQYNSAMENLPVDPKLKQKLARKQKKEDQNKNNRDKHLGDHGLVVMFQPFQGKWVQSLACFLTKGAASDEELTKLILESIILMEDAGYFVDGVVTDGATWNRAMWKKFGVSEENPTADHPCHDGDEGEVRQLHFISDFPHLLKCMRNCLVEKKTILTPEGPIKLEHWEAVVNADKIRQVGLKKCPRLTEEHIHPSPWAKMRCNLAWQFWSHSVSAGMDIFRLENVEELEDCQPSIDLCKAVNQLADVMNSRTPFQALRPNSTEVEVIKTFLARLEELEKYNTETIRAIELKAERIRIESLKKQKVPCRSRITDIQKKKWHVFSESTDTGLKVSLKATLKLLEFLSSEKIGYDYLMTARLNQDALERFFGLVRQSCGPNTHPESRVFAQLFRLLSLYSLVKPIKGSNITGGEMLSTLLTVSDLTKKTSQERKLELDRRLDDIVKSGKDLHQLKELTRVFHDHNYIDESLDEFALVYVCGYTARKSKQFAKECADCELSLILENTEKATDEHLLIKLKSRGYLTYPSDDLVKLLRHVERKVVTTAKNNELDENILFTVVHELESVQESAALLVGCEAHEMTLTKDILRFYLIMRMHFLCKSWNSRTLDIKKSQKASRKDVTLKA